MSATPLFSVPGGRACLPTIDTGWELDVQVEAAIDALETLNNQLTPRGRLGVRFGELIEVVPPDKGAPRRDERTALLASLPAPQLALWLAQAANWVRQTKYETKIAFPPPLVVQAVLTWRHWEDRFPVTYAITTGPILHEDGSVLWAEAHDPETAQLCLPDPTLNLDIIEHPTQTDAQAAWEYWQDNVWCSFPWQYDADVNKEKQQAQKDANRANAMGFMLSSIARDIIPWLIPLAAVSAPDRGTGKGLIVDVASVVATGIGPTLQSAPQWGETPEWRKSITATLLDPPRVMHIDNLEHRLESEALATMLTTGIWSDRILGVNKRARVTTSRTIWAVSGNNLEMSSDLIRRSYPIRLDAHTFRPWLRPDSEFKHPDLVEWCKEHRGELLSAALTMIRAWIFAGRPTDPQASVQGLGSFGKWANFVGGILAFAGCSGFLGNLIDSYEALDTESSSWAIFLEKWAEKHPTPATSQEVQDWISTTAAGDLRDVAPDVIAKPDLSTLVLGKRLRERLGRRYGEEQWYLVAAKNTAKARTWTVKKGADTKDTVPDEDF
jgi:DNA polymerase-1